MNTGLSQNLYPLKAVLVSYHMCSFQSVPILVMITAWVIK